MANRKNIMLIMENAIRDRLAAGYINVKLQFIIVGIPIVITAFYFNMKARKCFVSL